VPVKRGPPESPWQESIPPKGNEYQSDQFENVAQLAFGKTIGIFRQKYISFTVGDISGAQHGWVNFGVGSGTTIGAVASIIIDNWDIDAAQLVGDDTTRLNHANENVNARTKFNICKERYILRWWFPIRKR
jgi:hypothetical protein